MINKPSRRTVLKSISVLGAGGLLSACSAASAQTQEGPAAARTLENQHLRVQLHPDTLTVSVEDLAGKEAWSSDPWENNAGSMHLRSRHGESATIALSAATQKKITAADSDGEFALAIALDGFRTRLVAGREDRDPASQLSLLLRVSLSRNSPELGFHILELRNGSDYWAVESVEWPLRLFPVRTTTDDGYIVLPQEQGFMVPTRFDQGYFRNLNWVWERIAGWGRISSEPSMPWFGAKKGESSFLCVIDTPDDVAYALIANDVRPPEAPGTVEQHESTPFFTPRISAIWPIWRSVKGSLGYKRAARYIFQPHGGYVEMCKTYRRHAQKTGRFVSLKQKIAANPNVAKLVGASNFEIMCVSNHPLEPQYQGQSSAVYDGYHAVQTSFDQLTEIINDLKDKLGVEQAVIRIAGWGQMGYDNYRPIDELPVNKEAGGPEKLAAAIAAAKSAGYLAGLFDNYKNLDLNSPHYDEKYIMRDSEGALVAGFSSEGGHSQEICTQEGVKLIQHNVAYYKQALDPNMIYLDTIGGLSLTECYDPRHPLTRSQTQTQRLNLMRVATGANLVLGAEGPPQDWNLGEVSYYDEHSNHWLGIDVPLFGLVYHECALLYRQHDSPYDYGMDLYGYVREPWQSKFLRGLLYGDESSWTISNKDYWAWRDTFKSIDSILTPHHRRLAFDELLSHSILTPDLLVQRTKFSSGVEVTVNYGKAASKLEDGTELPGFGYRVVDAKPNGHSFSGDVETRIVPGRR
jgi:hypothetical protein